MYPSRPLTAVFVHVCGGRLVPVLPQYVANNAVWCLGIAGGAIVNVAYCLYLLHTNNTWHLFLSVKSESGSRQSGDAAKVRLRSSALVRMIGWTACTMGCGAYRDIIPC